MSAILSEKDYKYVFSRVPRLCVDLIIHGYGRTYLGQRKEGSYTGKFGLPGGRVRFGESIQETIDRIAATEIGLKVVKHRIFNVMEFLDEIENDKIHSVSISFIVKLEKEIVSSADFKSQVFDVIKHNHEIQEEDIISQHRNTVTEYLEYAIPKTEKQIFMI